MSNRLFKGVLLLSIALVIPAIASTQSMMGWGNGSGGMMGGFYNNRGEAVEKSEKVRSVLSEIRKEQGLKEGEPVNADKVSPKLLGELGDEVMEVVIGNHERHEWMDNMMGGEGSARLENIHEQMGYRYLLGLPIGMMGWGYGTGGTGNGYNGGMMGGYGNMMGYYGGFYGNNPYIPMMSLGSFMGMGTLMDINWILDYRFADFLGLTKDQVKKITDLKLSYEKDVDPVRSQLLDKRKQIFDLWSAAKPDEDAIKNADKDVLNLISAISDKGTEYRIKVLQILTPDQRKKMDYNGMTDYQNRYLNRNEQGKTNK